MSDIKINFSYNGRKDTLISNNQENMISIYKKYTTMIGKGIKDIFFLFNGDLINPEKKIKDISDEKEINILVYEFEEDEPKEDILKKSRDIICPICKEICVINFNNYKITFNNCKNCHTFSNILFNEFYDFQKINESLIICDKCGINKSKTTDNIFFKCFSCNINLCPLCKLKQYKMKGENHIIINYDSKNYYCNEHGERYIFHCDQFNKDFCDSCKSHSYKNSFLYKLYKKIDNKILQLRKKIDNLKNEKIPDSNIFNKVLQNLEFYYNIINQIINNYNYQKTNYYILMSISNISKYNEKIIEDLDQILNEDNIKIKNNYVSEIYEKMNIHSEFSLKYKLGKVGILRIFGEPFVKKK